MVSRLAVQKGLDLAFDSLPEVLAWRDLAFVALGSGEPKIGAHGKPVLFLHPKDFNGTLVELEQA